MCINALHFLIEQVFVANHTSMIDFIILEQVTPFAVIMQKHPGWVGESIAFPNTSSIHDYSRSRFSIANIAESCVLESIT